MGRGDGSGEERENYIPSSSMQLADVAFDSQSPYRLERLGTPRYDIAPTLLLHNMETDKVVAVCPLRLESGPLMLWPFVYPFTQPIEAAGISEHELCPRGINVEAHPYCNCPVAELGEESCIHIAVSSALYSQISLSLRQSSSDLYTSPIFTQEQVGPLALIVSPSGIPVGGFLALGRGLVAHFLRFALEDTAAVHALTYDVNKAGICARCGSDTCFGNARAGELCTALAFTESQGLVDLLKKKYRFNRGSGDVRWRPGDMFSTQVVCARFPLARAVGLPDITLALYFTKSLRTMRIDLETSDFTTPIFEKDMLNCLSCPGKRCLFRTFGRSLWAQRTGQK